ANRLRIALGDSAENPRYIETLARAGYRFIAPVQVLDVPSHSTVDVPSRSTVDVTGPTEPAHISEPSRWPAFGAGMVWAPVALTAVLSGAVGIWLGAGQPSPPDLPFRPLTFRRGQIAGARFTQDGHGVLYTANWDNGRRQLFQTQPSSPESRLLGFDG